jgi:hypothetical protein
MLSARTIFEEIFDNDETFRPFCSIAASGEAQGGWENGNVAALVPGSQAGLAPKIARHGADEDKHGRIFTALVRTRGLEPVAVPPDADYTVRLENAGIGLAHARLRPGDSSLKPTSSPTWPTAGSPSSAPASRCGRCAGMPVAGRTSPAR